METSDRQALTVTPVKPEEHHRTRKGAHSPFSLTGTSKGLRGAGISSLLTTPCAGSQDTDPGNQGSTSLG